MDGYMRQMRGGGRYTRPLPQLSTVQQTHFREIFDSPLCILDAESGCSHPHLHCTCCNLLPPSPTSTTAASFLGVRPQPPAVPQGPHCGYWVVQSNGPQGPHCGYWVVHCVCEQDVHDSPLAPSPHLGLAGPAGCWQALSCR